jgi:hypothetical protein
MGNRLGISFLVALSMLASACSGHRGAAPHHSTTTTVPTSAGVLTGTAYACSGPAYVATANLQVYRGNVLVATRRVPNGSTYRFVLPPGRYYITNTGNLESGLGRSATVVAADTSHVDVPDLCS